MSTFPSEVAGLLAQSMVQHQAAAAARLAKNAHDGNLLLEEARRLRLDADALDPNHSDPAWAAEQSKTPRGRDTHAELLTFYERTLGR